VVVTCTRRRFDFFFFLKRFVSLEYFYSQTPRLRDWLWLHCVPACRLCRRTSGHPAHRSSVPEPDAAQEEKAADVVHAQSDIAARGEVQQTQILVVCRPRGLGESAQDDRRASQNVVSKPTHQMEVIVARRHIYTKITLSVCTFVWKKRTKILVYSFRKTLTLIAKIFVAYFYLLVAQIRIF